MSTLQNQQWSSIPSDNLNNPKYEKCRNITEEIYKRINITFQIKKLETATHSELSDQSDQIDSNELSNETDLFACDKSSISSSSDPEKVARAIAACEKYININNNEETAKKPATVYKKPRKRFRKRVKKQQKCHRDTDGSSDEALPLSRVAELDGLARECISPSPPHNVMGVPNIVILASDLKPKFLSPSPERKPSKKVAEQISNVEDKTKAAPVDTKREGDSKRDGSEKEKNALEMKSCSLCSLSFRGERGLRRHITMSHVTNPEPKTNKDDNSA